MNSDLSPDDMQEIVHAHVTRLMEHFDAVQVLVSVCTDKGTESVFLGEGNWFARQGMAHDFITKDKATIEANELSKVLPRQGNADGEG